MISLNLRQQNIVKLLLRRDQTNAKEIAIQVNASKKTVYADLKVIIPYLSNDSIELIMKPRIGILIEGSDKSRQKAIMKLENSGNSLPSTNEERISFILMKLLESDGYLTIQNFADQLFISPKTIQKNLDSVSAILAKNDISLIRQAGKGIRINSDEGQRRRLIFKLFNGSWNNHWQLKQNSQGFREEFYLGEEGFLLSQNVVSKLILLINQFSQDEHFSFSDYSFQSLVIHLAIAIERVRNGNFIESDQEADNNLLEEREAAIRLADKVEDAFALSFPKQEIYYLQIHLIAAMRAFDQLTPQVNEDQIKFLEDHLSKIDYDNELISGLALHMVPAIKRLRLRLSVTNPFTEKIKQSLAQAFDDAVALKKDYEKTYSIQINDDETAYIALHFEAFYERAHETKDRIKVVVVCSTGLGSSRLLAAKLRKDFPVLDIQSVLSVKELMNKPPKDADLIISTINLEIPDIPTVIVSPLLNSDDARQIRRIVSERKSERRVGQLEFQSLIEPENLVSQFEARNWKEALSHAGQILISRGYAKDGLIESAIEREMLSYTSFANIATPHGTPDLINHPTILIETLKHPVKWGNQDVVILFFIALNQSIKKDQLDRLYSYFWDLIDNPSIIRELENATDSAEIYEGLLGVDKR